MQINPQKSLNNSFKNLDHGSTMKNQLNNSSSKMQYSFSKKSRFSDSDYKSFSPNRFYDIPTTKVNRATSLGYGKKLDLSKTNFITPPPDRYNAISQFKNDPKSGFTMAQGRKDVKANDMFYRSLKQCPEPASYNPHLYDDSLKFSMHPRLEDKSDKWVKSVPGPGAYTHLDFEASKQGKTLVSKHSSIPGTKFGHLKRLSQAQMANNKNPGPNQYKNTAQIVNQVKFQKKAGNVFSRSARQGIIAKSITPGPGNYSCFSEFA